MTNTPLGNRDLMRAMNRSILLNLIKSSGSIDRAELARRSGLSPATVTGITGELIADGLVFEKETGDSRGGRRPILLAINPQGGFVIGIKLTENQAIGALTDLEATVLSKQTLPLCAQTPEAVVQTLAQLAEQLLQAAEAPRARLLGIGVGLAGIVDTEGGILRTTPYFPWRDLPLRDLLQAQFLAPVYLENDVNTLTLAERWFGSGQGVAHFLTVTVGRGVGLGIVVNSQFYRGAGGGAGEFGHTVIETGGEECSCGKRGCLEAIAGEPALVRQGNLAFEQGRLPQPISSADELFALAQNGHLAAAAIFTRAGQALGTGIANLINLFNPQRIIINGEGARFGELLFPPMREAIRCHAMPGLYQDVEICFDPWGDDAWARGAASLVLRQLFESPVYHDSVPAGEH